MVKRGIQFTPVELAAFGVALFVCGWFLRVLIHEVGHAVPLLLFGAEHVYMRLGVFTGSVSVGSDLEDWQRVIVLVSGSGAVALVALLLARNKLVDRFHRVFLQVVAIIWVVFEALNMAPLAATDGGKLGAVWGETVQWGVVGALVMFGVYLLAIIVAGSGKNRVRVRM